LKSARIGLLSMLFTVPIMLLIGFIDIFIVTPLILPEDECYYHFNTPPNLVDLFYLDSTGHIDPLDSKFHLLTLLVLSITFAFLTASRINEWMIKRKEKRNTNSP
jgi:hypothetical protein